MQGLRGTSAGAGGTTGNFITIFISPRLKVKQRDMFSNVGTKNTFQATQCGPQLVYARLWGLSKVHPHVAQQTRLWPLLAMV